MTFYKIKDEVAFKAIKNKRLVISGTIPDTEDGVIVRSVDSWDRDLSSSGYKYRLRDLEQLPT